MNSSHSSLLLLLTIVSLLTSQVTPLFIGLPILTCNPACLTCSGPNADQCTTCLAGLLPLLGTCKCPDGKYSTGGLLSPCSNCNTACVTCDGPATSDCLSCSSGKLLYQGTCYPGCTSSLQYFDTTLLSCQACNSLCLTCNGAGASKCTSCQTATLTSGACVCPVGQYTIALGACANCNPTCKGCSGPADTQCTSCNTGMILQSGKCVCSTGTYLVTSPSVSCTACDPRCLGCSGGTSNDCTSCRSGFELSGGQCNCPSGYYYDSGTLSCVACYNRCTSCFGTAFNQCTACKNNLQQLTLNQCDCPDGTYLDTTLMTCRACDPSCLKCSGPSASQCTDCDTGFALTSGQCLCSGGLCSCPTGTYPDTGLNTCQPCNPTCQECSGPLSTQCDNCWSGFTLSGGSCTCDAPPSCNCPAGTYYDSGSSTCKKCHATCKTCTGGSDNECIDCVNDLTHVTTATSCGCSAGYYMDPSYFCFPCDPTCQTCSGPSAIQCSSCKAGMGLPNPLCTCPTGKYFDSGTQACATCDANCASCDGPEVDQCKSCGTGKTLSGGLCLVNCASNQYRDTLTDHSCQPCDSTCKTCSGGSATECNSCQAPRTFTSGSCPDLTSAGCHYTCRTCKSASSLECLTCHPGMVLVEDHIGYGYCASQCPTGYYSLTLNSQVRCRQKIRLDNRLAYGPQPFMIELTYDRDITPFVQELILKIEVAIEYRPDQPDIKFRYDLTPTAKGTSLMLSLTFYGHLLPRNVLRIKYVLPAFDSPDNKTIIYVTRKLQTLTLMEFFEDPTGTSDISKAFGNISAIGQITNQVFSWTSSMFLRSVHALRSEIVEDMIGYFIFMNIDYTPNFVEFAEQGLGAFELLMPNLFMPVMDNGIENNPDDEESAEGRILLEGSNEVIYLPRHAHAVGKPRMLLSKQTETLFNMRLDDREFLINHGAATSLLLIGFGVIIVLDVMKYVIDKTVKPGRLRRYIRAASVALRWNFLVGHYSSEYQGFIFFAIIQLVNNKKPTEGRDVLTFLFGMFSFLFSSLAVVAAFLVARRANIKLEALEHAKTSEKEDIDTDLKRIGLFFESFREEAYMQLLYPGFLVTRCFLFGVVLVFLTDYTYVQISYLILSTLGIIAYLAYIKPLKKPAQNTLTIVYECFFLVISVLSLVLHVYNGYNIEDVETRSWICFIILTVATAMIVLNMISLGLEILEFRKLFFKKAKVTPIQGNTSIAKLNESQGSPQKTAITRVHSTNSAISIPNFGSDAEDQPIKALRKDLNSLYSPKKRLTKQVSDDETLTTDKRETLVDLLNRKKRSDAPSILLTDENAKKRSSSKISPEPESAGSNLLNKIRAKPLQQHRDTSPKRSDANRGYEIAFQRFDSSQMPSVNLTSNTSKPAGNDSNQAESQNFDNKIKPMLMSRNMIPTLTFEDIGKNAPSNNFLTLHDLEAVDSGASKRGTAERKSVRMNNSFQSLKPPDRSQDEIRTHSMVLQENDGSRIEKWAPPKSADRNRLPGSQSILQDEVVVVPRKMIQVKHMM